MIYFYEYPNKSWGPVHRIWKHAKSTKLLLSSAWHLFLCKCVEGKYHSSWLWSCGHNWKELLSLGLVPSSPRMRQNHHKNDMFWFQHLQMWSDDYKCKVHLNVLVIVDHHKHERLTMTMRYYSQNNFFHHFWNLELWESMILRVLFTIWTWVSLKQVFPLVSIDFVFKISLRHWFLIGFLGVLFVKL